MINVSDVATGLLGLGVIAGAVGLVALGGRDRTADQHDLTDYHELAPIVPSFSFTLAERGLAQMRADLTGDDVLPPGPTGMNAGSPLYAETLFRTWHPDAPAVVAARMLREIADDERAKDGIGPDGHAWQLDGSCWADCPGCAYDLTGAFPVVAVTA